MALDPLLLQHAVQREPVQPRLLDRNDRIALAGARQRLALQLRKLRQQRPRSPAATPCFDIFSPLPGDSEVINQVERLSSNETKIAQDASDSGRFSVSDTISEQHRSSSRLSGLKQPQSGPRMAAIHSPWNLRFLLAMTARWPPPARTRRRAVRDCPTPAAGARSARSPRRTARWRCRWRRAAPRC